MTGPTIDEPWERLARKGEWRLGAKLDANSFGWAALAKPKIDVSAAGVLPAGPDPIAVIIAKYRAMVERDGEGDGIELYDYATADAFARSRAAAEGMTHAEHGRMIAHTMARLRAAGIRVVTRMVS